MKGEYKGVHGGGGKKERERRQIMERKGKEWLQRGLKVWAVITHWFSLFPEVWSFESTLKTILLIRFKKKNHYHNAIFALSTQFFSTKTISRHSIIHNLKVTLLSRKTPENSQRALPRHSIFHNNTINSNNNNSLLYCVPHQYNILHQHHTSFWNDPGHGFCD